MKFPAGSNTSNFPKVTPWEWDRSPFVVAADLMRCITPSPSSSPRGQKTGSYDTIFRHVRAGPISAHASVLAALLGVCYGRGKPFRRNRLKWFLNDRTPYDPKSSEIGYFLA